MAGSHDLENWSHLYPAWLKTKHRVPVRPLKTVFMTLMNVAGAVRRQKGILRYAQWPCFVLNAVLSTSFGSISI
jgi:hypothetical protein